MSEIKFACPHCAQRVACDANYCGVQITCPACQSEMTVPRTAASASPAASRKRQGSAQDFLYPRPKDAAYWTEGEWNKHVAQVTGHSVMTQWQFIIFLVFALPALALGLLFLGCAVCG